MSHEAAFDKLAACLRQAMDTPDPQEVRTYIAEAIQRTERLQKAVTTAAVKRGRKGGLATAERGPEYFKRIAAMRKTRGGGRPRKSES